MNKLQAFIKYGLPPDIIDLSYMMLGDDEFKVCFKMFIFVFDSFSESFFGLYMYYFNANFSLLLSFLFDNGLIIKFIHFL